MEIPEYEVLVFSSRYPMYPVEEQRELMEQEVTAHFKKVNNEIKNLLQK